MSESGVTMGLLRPIKDKELELMLSWRNEPDVRNNMYTTHEISLTEHREWWKRMNDSSTSCYFIYESQGKPLGIVGFTDIDEANQNSSWAFYASSKAPKGTGSRMEFLALNYAFYELNVHKLCCEVLAFNTPVIKLHEKFGFKVEGILREQYQRKGKFIDVYRLGMLSNEWKAARGKMEETLNRFAQGRK